MKTITLLAAVTLISATTVTASEVIQFSEVNANVPFSINDPISFTERGIAFYVFPNGEFDFNTATSQNSATVYRDGRRSNNQTYGTPINQGVKIEHDALGRVRRIGNVFVNYDAQNRIKRIGSVYMTYNRIVLTQVGNLKIIYDRRGRIINTIGSVKGYYNYCSNADFEEDDYSHQNSNEGGLFFRKNGTKVEGTKK